MLLYKLNEELNGLFLQLAAARQANKMYCMEYYKLQIATADKISEIIKEENKIKKA